MAEPRHPPTGAASQQTAGVGQLAVYTRMHDDTPTRGDTVQAALREYRGYVEAYTGERFGRPPILLPAWSTDTELDSYNRLQRYAVHDPTDTRWQFGSSIRVKILAVRGFPDDAGMPTDRWLVGKRVPPSQDGMQDAVRARGRMQNPRQNKWDAVANLSAL